MRDPNDIVFDLFHTHECEWVNGSPISTQLHTSHPILNETLWFSVDPVKRDQVNILQLWRSPLTSWTCCWTWVTLAKKGDIVLSKHLTTSLTVEYGDTHLGNALCPQEGFYAMRCTFLCRVLMLALFIIYLDRRPHCRTSVLDHEIITDTPRGHGGKW